MSPNDGKIELKRDKSERNESRKLFFDSEYFGFVQGFNERVRSLPDREVYKKTGGISRATASQNSVKRREEGFGAVCCEVRLKTQAESSSTELQRLLKLQMSVRTEQHR